MCNFSFGKPVQNLWLNKIQWFGLILSLTVVCFRDIIYCERNYVMH